MNLLEDVGEEREVVVLMGGVYYTIVGRELLGHELQGSAGDGVVLLFVALAETQPAKEPEQP